MVINGYVPRLTTITTLLSSRGPVLGDVVCGRDGTRPGKSNEERCNGEMLDAAQQVIWHSDRGSLA